MFTDTQAVFFYAVTPVHMGSGNAVGVIDNPIQRERHTGHPNLAGSGLKGALRHRWQAVANSEEDRSLLAAIFGPDKNASEFAGAVSLSDAQLVLFPVRATRQAFVYATCRTALARTLRSLQIAGVDCGWVVPPNPGEGKAWVTAEGDKDLLHEGRQLGLEWFAYTAEVNEQTKLAAKWLAEHALPTDHGFFREHLQKYMVVLPDEDFGFFVRHSTSVEPHVRIDDASGTADGGGLFYSENLPPESLLLALVMASQERSRTGKNREKGHGGGRSAAELQTALRERTHGKLLQIGGDATTGRGHVIPVYAGKEGR